ncbi:transposon TX1 putative protein [Trifolium medium]|uniref:LINE-1 reverse transcriptase like n=1 Tax=Trifolium medium TaxID=97028 RepID=A0A392NG60_9FABA|nr:transposon TX1 putative protein [Trifolium medium]
MGIWGPKPFRFNNHWLEHKHFKEVVEVAWEENDARGWMGYVVKEKLKSLKVRLKEWNKVEYGSMDLRIKTLIEDIQDLDIRGELSGLASHDVALRKELFDEFWNLQKSKEALLFQRSRSKWLTQGDANSKFFHGCVVARTKRNSITALKNGDIWLESPSQIREEVVSYFSRHFSASHRTRPNLDGIPFPRLSLEDQASLTVPFSLEEIEHVVKESDGNKSPGPDGFNFAFLKNCWNIVKVDIWKMFEQFYMNGRIPKSFLSYFVALIPKVNSPFGLGDFM